MSCSMDKASLKATLSTSKMDSRGRSSSGGGSGLFEQTASTESNERALLDHSLYQNEWNSITESMYRPLESCSQACWEHCPGDVATS
jgi:hypothetical protein